MLDVGGLWFGIKDGDPRGHDIMSRHYSKRNYLRRRNTKFIGPGEKLVLMTADSLALFAWRKFIDDSGQTGINCAIFRNEGPYLSSTLILEAETFAWARWPGERLYTYVSPNVLSPNPGYCFLMAGWRRCGRTKQKHLHILEKLP